MPDAKTRIPERLLADRAVTGAALRIWCWIDHQCRATGAPVHTTGGQLGRQLQGTVHRDETKKLLHRLEAAGWVELEYVTDGDGANAGFLVRTLRKP